MKPKNLIWSMARVTASDRLAGRFLRSDEGHEPALAADPASTADPAATADPAPEGQADPAAAVDPAAETAKTEGADEGADPAKVEGGEDDGTLLTDGVKAEGEGDPAQTEGDPAPYEGLTAPEGFDGIDAEALAAATPLMRSFGVADDQAQAFIDQAAPVIAGMVERQAAAVVAAQAAERAEIERGWVEEIRAHPEYGGANLERSLTDAARARDKIFSPKFNEFLKDSRLGNNPDMFAGLVKMGRMIAEDTVDTTDATAPAAGSGRLYGPNYYPDAD